MAAAKWRRRRVVTAAVSRTIVQHQRTLTSSLPRRGVGGLQLTVVIRNKIITVRKINTTSWRFGSNSSAVQRDGQPGEAHRLHRGRRFLILFFLFTGGPYPGETFQGPQRCSHLCLLQPQHEAARWVGVRGENVSAIETPPYTQPRAPWTPA